MKNQMKGQKIGTRLGITTAIAVLCAALIAFLATFFLLSRIISNKTENTAKVNGNFVETELEHMGNELALTSNIFASDTIIADAVVKNDRAAILEHVGVLSQYINLPTNNITFLDMNGTVIARFADPDNFGDSMADKGFFQEAAQYKQVVGFESTKKIPLGMRATNPIVSDGGAQVGVITVTFDMANNEFLQNMKDENEEYSIFGGNTIIASTMEEFVGAPMDAENEEKVLKNGEIIAFKTTLNDKPYNVCLGPITSNDGEILGAYFAGVDIDEEHTQEMISIFVAVGICVLAVVVAVLVTFLITRKHVVKPIGSLVEVASEMAQGNLSVQITTNEGGEIGVLSASLKDVIDKLQLYIGDISDKMNDMANGDLTAEITHEYVGDFQSIKTSINHIASSLNNTLSSINIAAEQVNAGADQVANAAQSLSQGATEQASSIQELSSSIMSVSEQVSENAKNVNTAGSYVAESERGIENSSKYMEQMMQAMNDISESSAEISKVIKVIDDIAFQTNILALNAAVEAARAGAAGKGFSVVADEVRNLASKSAEAVKQTTVLIETAVSSAQKGVEIAGQTSTALESVKTQSEKIVDIIKKVQTASNDQADAINQITIGVEQISSVVQTNSATSEQSAAASEELSGQAQMLQEEVRNFKLRKGGASSSGNPSPFGGSGMSSSSAPSSDTGGFTIDLDSDKY